MENITIRTVLIQKMHSDLFNHTLKKAEPFKRWLAKVGYERVQEIQNPELAQERMKQLYEQKGYSQEWIEKRVRGIAIRQELTDEWKQRGIDKNLEYAILTNEISKQR